MTDKELDPDLSARLEKAIDKHLGKQPEPCDNVWCQQNEDKNKGWKSGCALFSDLNRCAIYRSWQSRPNQIEPEKLKAWIDKNGSDGHTLCHHVKVCDLLRFITETGE